MPRVLGHMYAAIASVAETIKVEGLKKFFFYHSDCPFLLFFVFLKYFIVTYGKLLTGNSGRLTSQKPEEQRYLPFLPVCAVFSCVQTMEWLPVGTDVDACMRLHTDTARD